MTKMLDQMSESEVNQLHPETEESGFGALDTERGRLPLKAMDVHVRIDGLIAQTIVTQTFVNTFPDPLEATYIFPLPDRAAVTRFRMEVAGRIIEGTLKERAEARREYTEAIQAGHRAAITEEDRPGVFTLRVGNLMPNDEAVITLTLAGPLPYSDGEATFRFPLVVAPRYIPGTPLPGPQVGDGVSPDTDAVPDASRISPPVLLPGFPNPVRLSLAVDVLPSGLPVDAIRSSLHAVEEEVDGRIRRICVQPGERLNRDFIMRLSIRPSNVHTSLAVCPDIANSREGTFALTLVPASRERERPEAARPRDIVFVLDRSGSMGGWKMVAARRAVSRMVETLLDQDRFNVLAFDDTIETPPLGPGAMFAATSNHRFRAAEFLSKIEARNGTEMAQPLQQAAAALTDASRDRVLVLITDGQVGNEDQILRELGKQLKGIRVFCLGIDQAVNAAFLRRLADIGGGGCELVESEERLDATMDQVHRKIGQPVLTGLKLTPAGLELEANTLTPDRLPDVFAGVPAVVLGRYRGTGAGSLTVEATDANGKAWKSTVNTIIGDNPAVAAVWARGQVRKLEDRYLTAGSSPELQKQIVATSLKFGVLCRFTAFVAVDRSAVVNKGGEGEKILQPVEMPAEWAAAATTMTLSGHVAYSMAPAAASERYVACRAMPAAAAFDGAASDALLEDSEAVEPATWPGTQTQPPRSSGLFGWLGNLFSAIFRSKGTPPSAPVDLSAFRERIAEMHQDLCEITSTDANDRWVALNKLRVELERILQEIAQLGSSAPEVERLARLFVALQSLPTPNDEVALNALWTEADEALREFAGIPAESRRESFWA